MKIYIVFGDSGGYDAYSEWMVGAYVDEEKAKGRVSELENLMEELGLKKDRKDTFGHERKAMALKMIAHEKGDPYLEYSEGGLHYNIKSVNLMDIQDYLKVNILTG